MQADGRLAVIDGNRNFHPVMRGILRSLGYRRIDPFLEGAEALEHMRATWCDLAFIDLTLADGSGLALIQSVRREKVINRHMPIVVLTTFTSRRNIEDAMAAGADYVLAKPVSPKLLGERMRFLKERPVNYVALSDGYFGPDPARYQRSQPAPGLLAASIARAGARLQSATAEAEGEAPRDATAAPDGHEYASLRPPSDLIFLD